MGRTVPAPSTAFDRIVQAFDATRDELSGEMMNVEWISGESLVGPCPVCGSEKTRAVILRARDIRPPHDWIPMARCPDCGSLNAEGVKTPEYEIDGLDGDATKFYLEQGAGIYAMVRPLYAIDRSAVRNYLEVGCGYGLSLDFAGHIFGWDARGIDPSPLAAAGKEQLGLNLHSGYLKLGEPLDGAPFDVVMCSEVIEHVPDPDAFVKTLAGVLADDGYLILTTPNEACVRPDGPPGTLLPAITPGFHLMVFSEKGFHDLLVRNGFPHVDMIVSEFQLVAIARRVPRPVDLSQPVDRQALRTWMLDRMGPLPHDHPLWCGLAYRMMREHVDAREDEEALALFGQLAAMMRDRYGFDIENPAGIDFPREVLSFKEFIHAYPANLGAVLFARGALARNRGEDPELVRQFFRAAEAGARLCRGGLISEGMDDVESAHLGQEAVPALLLSEVQIDPDAAADEWLATLEAVEAGSERTRRDSLIQALPQLFMEIINRGGYDAAERIWNRLGLILSPSGEASGGDAVPPSLWFAAGMLLMNHRGDFLAAAGHFRQAGRLAKLRIAAGEDSADMRGLEAQAILHEGLAMRQGGQATQALAAPQLLIDLVGAGHFATANHLWDRMGLDIGGFDGDAERVTSPSFWFASGILMMNHRGDYVTAAICFRRAAHLAQRALAGIDDSPAMQDLYWQAELHQGLAMRHGSRALFHRLKMEPADRGIPDPVRARATALFADMPEG